MALPKNPKADLKRKYKRTLEISFVLSAVFIIAAFKLFPNVNKAEMKFEKEQELVKVEDIIKTKQDVLPPPPPKPPIPIEAPSDEMLEDIVIESTDIDLTDNVPPPPLPIDDDKRDVSAPFWVVEEMPEPIGGIESILKKIEYPEIAKRAGIEGKVTVRALVDRDGNVENVELLKGIGMGCDDEALEAVKETKFKPGKQRGKPVRVYITIPIVFELR